MNKNESKQQGDNAAGRLAAVEELRKRHKTPGHIFCGICAMKGWVNGKAVSEREYLDAAAAFLKSPAGGKKDVK